MARRKYPRIGESRKLRPRWCRCGKIATRRVDIQVSYMRGGDIVVYAYGDHCRDLDYLLAEVK